MRTELLNELRKRHAAVERSGLATRIQHALGTGDLQLEGLRGEPAGSGANPQQNPPLPRWRRRDANRAVQAFANAHGALHNTRPQPMAAPFRKNNPLGRPQV